MTLPAESYRHIGILHTSPLILMTCLDSFDPFGYDIAKLVREMTSEKFSIFVQVWKSIEYLAEVDSEGLAALLRSVSQCGVQARVGAIVMLCNTQNEVDICKKYGCEAEFISHNCLANENIFFPVSPKVKREYDAIYNAQMWEIKRHELARNIKSLSLIYSLHLGQEAMRRLSRVVQLLPSAHLVNGNPLEDPTDFRLLNGMEVNEAYNAAKVGLCLSAVEGAMFSSVEYLLSGLPVVTTRNKGGRDTFFQGPYCVWAEDDPQQISEAVTKLVECDHDPLMIRAETMRLLQYHRDRLRMLVVNHVSRLGGVSNGVGIFPRVLTAQFGMPIKSVKELSNRLGYCPEEDAQTGALTPDQVVFAYKLLHQREPESEGVISHILATCPTVAAFRRELFGSREFRNNIADRLL